MKRDNPFSVLLKWMFAQRGDKGIWGEKILIGDQIETFQKLYTWTLIILMFW
jgi:hypothetical protein